MSDTQGADPLAIARLVAAEPERYTDAAAALARAYVELDDARQRGTEALRAAFGEELWSLGHPAYVVAHLREELAKATRLWKDAMIKKGAAESECQRLREQLAQADWFIAHMYGDYPKPGENSVNSGKPDKP